MTPEQQRIAIAKACGYSAVSSDYMEQVDIDSRSIQMWTQWMGEKHGVRIKVPAYVNDLNAMHEAEKAMNNTDWWKFVEHLTNICGGGTALVISATAAQRAEAFLRAIGKWEASK